MDNYVILALIATMGTWLVTALGAATVAFFKSPNPKILNLMLGFASGVMITVSVIDLIPESFNLLKYIFPLFPCV